MKKIILKIGIIIFSFIALTLLGVFFLMHSNMVLVSFNIREVKNIYNTFFIKFDKVKAAKNYKVELTDSNANIIYSFITETNDNQVIINNMDYNKEYSLMVYAYDDKGNYMPCKQSYEFVYNYPSINRDNLVLNNSKYELNILGDISDKEYYLNITQDSDVLYNERIINNKFEIPDKLYLNKQIELKVELICEGIVIDSINLFNDLNPIKDINIITPSNNTSIIYNDLSIIYEGGDNAKSISINIYDGKKLVLSKETDKKKVLVSAALFVPDKEYRLDIIGTYEEYTKKSSIIFNMVGRPKLKPVYINVNPKTIKKGTKVVLKQPEGAKIYYTLDGSDPTTNGKEYIEPIEINQNVKLRTIAKANLYNDSKVTDYDFNVIDKKSLKIYISPSNQYANLGVKSTGFTSEKAEMNKIPDFVIERLKQFDIKVYRNNPAGNINQWNNDANYLGVDFKLAIHSNASVDHTAYGVETWVDSENSTTYSIASVIQDEIIDLYPYKDREGYNRGVRYALGEIGEANDSYVRNGILIEVAHHDDELDAKWIKDHEKEIGYRLADAILKYFQVI